MPHRPSFPSPATWRALLESALAEDLGAGDVTSQLVLPEGLLLEAVIEAREPLVVCGLPLAEAVFASVDPNLRFHAERSEGAPASAGEPVARISGPARALLAAERTALNFLARLCGVASFTRRFVEEVNGTGAAVVDTRKTLPGWRTLDKYAVAVGGGVNHRVGLYDAILIKDNHLAAAGGVEPAVKAARAGAPAHLWLQVEVESEADAEAALQAGADALLLDNQGPEALSAFVARFGSRTVLEASGGIGLHNLRQVAETGVHRISIGALTHSAPSADLALEVCGRGVRG